MLDHLWWHRWPLRPGQVPNCCDVGWDDGGVSRSVRREPGGLTRRQRYVRRPWVVVSVLLIVGLAGCGSAGDTVTAFNGPEAASTLSHASGPAEGWVELPRSPLGPRARSVGVWTGREVLLVGGDTFMCPPSASCVAPVDPPLVDAAAFDPSTGAWRTTASSPVAFSWASTAVLGDDVYFLVPGESGRPKAETAFLRYSIAADAWTQLPRPPFGRSSYSIIAAGAVIVASAGSDEHGREPDQLFDPAAQTWEELPAAPLSPAFDRVMTWSGTHLYVFDHELVANPGSERPSLTRAARLDLGSRTWERLPDSEILGTGPWLADATLLVTPMLGGADGGEVNNWGRSYPYGGIFDSSTSAWLPLPTPPAGAQGAGVIGTRNAFYVATGGSLLDLESRSWIDLPRLPDATAYTERTVLSAGPDAFVFGGVRWLDGTNGELLGDAWIWRSGRG